MNGSPNLILVGFMGTGKTTVGKILSKKLCMKFIDIDELIEKTLGMKISQIFNKFGESLFRDIESEIIKIVTKSKGQVISAGGGAILREENFTNFKKAGKIFCLVASEETIFERLKNCKDRPLLMVENPLEKIKELMKERMPFYEKADYRVITDNKSPHEVAKEIIEILGVKDG